MRKLNYLLHNVTIIHFPRLMKLGLRYRVVTLIFIIAAFICAPVLYFNQPVIYQKEARFKVLGQSSLTAEKAAPDSVASSNNVNIGEVISSIQSYDFVYKLATRMSRSKFWEEFNFLSPLSNDESKSLRLKDCTDEKCRVELLKGILPQFYEVTPEATTGRFSLKVSTRSARTTLEILGAFEKTLEEIRIKNSEKITGKQVAQLEELVSKSKQAIEAKNGFVKVASAEFLDAMITQHKEKIRNIASRLIRDDTQNFTQQIKLKESALASEAKIGEDQMLNYENFSKLQKRISELRQNIASINQLPEASRTESDKLVLTGLQAELESSEKELSGFGKMRRNVSMDDNFLNVQKGSKSALEYDYRISEAQVRKLRAEHERAKKELDRLFSQKAELETELVTLKPDLEYHKLLESRLVALKFHKSSVSSDILVDTYGTEVTTFKRNSPIKIGLFTITLMLFLCFNTIIICYLFDDRIFEELEVEHCIDDLPVVGHAPKFDQFT